MMTTITTSGFGRSIMNKELCNLICGCLQTDECIAHCNYDPCCTCERLANYLEANGCVILPWKIGDTIYYITDRGTIARDTVIRLTITKKSVNPLLEKHTTGFWKHYKWFRTLPEAEDYLKQEKRV